MASIQPKHRSRMNICCTLADDALTATFLSDATARGLMNLKGHAMMGGIRISLYNAMPDDGVEALAGYMCSFAQEHGNHV
jgi:phosphoserine aminotransferase